MRPCWRICLWLIAVLAGAVDLAYGSEFHDDYGLYFRSHNASGTERTSLFLNNDRPFRLRDDFVISFKMLVREREADFGPVLHLCTDAGQNIRFSFVSGQDRHYPALVLNERIEIIDRPIVRNVWLDVTLHLRPRQNVVELDYGGARIDAQVDLAQSRHVTARFGVMPEYSSDVAPVNLRDVVIVQRGDTIRHWRLRKHDDDLCYDEIHRSPARALYPYWTVDNHIEWVPILHRTIPGRVDVAFDAREARFFFVREDAVELFDETGAPLATCPVVEGCPATTYPNHLIYDTLSRQLVSYFPETGRVSRLDPAVGRWSVRVPNPDEPHFYNHARAFNPADSSFYFFGGYGFYQYRNELFRWKSGSDRVERIDYQEPFYPRYSAAAAVVGDELFVFGGRGNKYGKQEITSYFYFGMHAINLRTLHSRQVWMKEESTAENIMASTMYFHAADSSFYAVSLNSGGVLWRISMNEPRCVEVSKPIGNNLDFQDGDFSLYASPRHGKMFLVMDKILSDRTHDVSIYSIELPLADEADIRQTVGRVRHPFGWLWTVAGAVLLLLAAALFVRRRRAAIRRVGLSLAEGKNTSGGPGGPGGAGSAGGAGGAAFAAAACEAESAGLPARGGLSDASDVEASISTPAEVTAPATVAASSVPEPARSATVVPRFYDHTRASIRLLGNFRVFDRNGLEITAHFTPKLKNLLILLILYSERDARGILALKATEILWPDKDGNAARNNRNVSLRKLRVLLESIGNAEIVAENNFLRIDLGDNLFCDYHEVVACIRRFQQPGAAADPDLLHRIFELLLCGPLLPNTIADWLDDFKDAYSSLSIDLLKKLLALERQQNHQEMILRIANIMFLHDPLNEEALAAKCAVLSAQGKNGIARNVYDRFCKEYRKSIGEEFGTPFSDL